MAIVIGAWTLRPELISLRSPTPARASVNPLLAQETRDREFAQRRFAVKSVELKASLGALQTAFDSVSVVQRSRAAQASGAVDLRHLTAARLTSSGEINSLRETSFAPANPPWQGDSRADPTVGGTYDGDQGSGTLTVSVTAGGVRRSSEIRLDIRDSDGNFIEEVVLQSSDPIDTLYPLSNGLTLRFDGGRLIEGDSFTIDVRDDLDFEIDPAAAFDGSSGEPNFDAGEAIVAGSFLVNGVTIDVFASDSVDSVLARIESSAAGVTATYDRDTESVVLVQKTPGAGPSVTVGGDTSGFLSAVKLDDGVLVAGTDGGPEATLASLPGFAGIGAGSFAINGVAIAIDPSTDTLRDILDRIGASAAGVQIRLVRDRQIFILNEDSRAELELSSNGTRLFEALQIVPGLYAASGRGKAVSATAIDAIANATTGLIRAYNRFVAFDPYVSDLPETRAIREAAEAAFADAIRRTTLGERDIGLRFDRADDQRRLELVDGNQRALRSGLRADFDRVRSFYLGAEKASNDGLIGRLSASLAQRLAQLPASVRVGVFVDSIA